ncbi:MAG TPA: hypothetical protein VGP96_13300 [Candidatus Dormibacteraeota bacterium]|nr:hypothetical protein [Candidatus Dormibacteraeota bacterium]
MTPKPLPLFPPGDDPAERRRHDLVERLDWVIRRRFEELPDTLVAALRAQGVVCDRTSSPHDLADQLRGDQPERRAAAS